MPRRLSSRAIAAMAIILAVMLNGSFCYWLVQTNVNEIVAERQAQQIAGIKVEARLCRTFELLYEDEPPAGNAKANPSRAYLQELHARLGEVLPDLGCASGG